MEKLKCYGINKPPSEGEWFTFDIVSGKRNQLAASNIQPGSAVRNDAAARRDAEKSVIGHGASVPRSKDL
jgi:hypothetical protein